MAADPRRGLGVRADPRRRLGALGERLAREHLEARGFEVVDRNFRTCRGELDLVARDALFLVFCEVKTRVLGGEPGPLGPFAAIDWQTSPWARAAARSWTAPSAPATARCSWWPAPRGF